MARVAPGLDHGDVHSLASHVLDRSLGEPRADTAPLVLGVDADDVDNAHPFMEGVKCDGDETHRAFVCDGDEDVSVSARTTRAHRRSLVRFPVGVQAEKYVIAENGSQGCEHWRPGAKRELDDRIEVAPGEGPDLDQLVGHGHRPTVAAVDHAHAVVRCYPRCWPQQMVIRPVVVISDDTCTVGTWHSNGWTT